MNWTEQECNTRCLAILDAIVETAKDIYLSDEKEADTYGSASWAKADDLKAAGYLYESIDSKSFILGPAADGYKFIAVPKAEAAMHAIVCGPTGVGKSSSVFIPNLIERTGTSAIVTEATAGTEPPDLFYKTSGFRKTAGHMVYKFNPDDLSSNRINPLQYIKTYDQASQIANLIIENTSSKYTIDSTIWENSERQLLTTLIVHAVAESSNLGAIRKCLRKGPNGLKDILMNSSAQEAREEFWGFYSSSSEGFRNGVVSGLMQRLNLWVNPRIIALTETTDIDISSLSEQLFTFYLAVPAQKTYLKPLAALVLNFLVNLTLEKTFKHPIGLFLDEFTNYGYIPGIAEKLTIIRHREIPAILGFQDYSQLLKVYGDQDASLLFSQPGTKIFFRPRETRTARKISESLGTKTITDRKITSSGHIQEREIARLLMNTGEVMALPKGSAITFTPSTPPLLLKTFTWQEYKEATCYEPPVFNELEVDENLIKQCGALSQQPDWQKKYDQDLRGKSKIVDEPSVKNTPQQIESTQIKQEKQLDKKDKQNEYSENKYSEDKHIIKNEATMDLRDLLPDI